MHLTPAWSYKLDKERNVGTRRPVVSGPTVYLVFHYEKAGFFESRLLALDLASGAEKWSYRIDHVGNVPLVHAGTVFWSSFGGSIHALGTDGALLWQAPAAGRNLGVPVAGSGDRLFVGETGGRSEATWALDRHSGQVLWKFVHGGHTAGLCCSEGRVYHGSVASSSGDEPPRGSFYCLSEADGSVQWKVSTDSYLFNPVVIGSAVAVCSGRSLRLHACRDGDLLAELPLGEGKETWQLAPAATPDRLHAWKDARGEGAHVVTAVDATRRRRLFGGERVALSPAWSLTQQAGLCDAPITLAPDRLACLTHEGQVRLLDAASGAPSALHDLKTKKSPSGGLAHHAGGLVATHGRQAFAFLLRT